jgi:hypothetical protein
MSKRPFSILAVLTAIAIIILLSMGTWANKFGNKKNGFSRRWNNEKLSLLKKVNNTFNAYQISGASSTRIYFHGQDVTKLFSETFTLDSVELNSINLKVSHSRPEAFEIQFLDSNIFLFDRNRSVVQKVKLGETVNITTKYQLPIFTRVMLLDPNYAIVRGFDSTRHKQYLFKVSNTTGAILKTLDIFPDNNDGGLASEGNLLLDKSLNKAVYFHYFKNSFFCIDTSLNLITTTALIDTSTSSMIPKTGMIQKGNTQIITSNTPETVVTLSGFCYEGNLFLLSNLKADNENVDSFRNYSCLDKYSVSTGKYLGSAYLPFELNKSEILDMQVYNSRIYVLTQKNIYGLEVDKFLTTAN